MVGERQIFLSNVICALLAEKLVRKGCDAYLAYILYTNVDIASLQNIRVVKDFPDIFLEELAGLPLD